jgi:hypothetical protein
MEGTVNDPLFWYSFSWGTLLWGMLLSALAGAVIGKFRGRAFVGGLVGLLLGPVGWLLILLGPDHRAKCPECRGVIDPRAKRCPHCREPL